MGPPEVAWGRNPNPDISPAVLPYGPSPFGEGFRRLPLRSSWRPRIACCGGSCRGPPTRTVPRLRDPAKTRLAGALRALATKPGEISGLSVPHDPETQVIGAEGGRLHGPGLGPGRERRLLPGPRVVQALLSHHVLQPLPCVASEIPDAFRSAVCVKQPYCAGLTEGLFFRVRVSLAEGVAPGVGRFSAPRTI